MSRLFGGIDPFDDPFFTHPFGGIFGAQANSSRPSKEITIEELDSDGNPLKDSQASKQIARKNPNQSNFNGTRSFSYQRVSYGGLNGKYYTSSITRKTGGDAVVLMEVNEEDKTVGEALHTVSGGIRDKGQSVTTKRNSDGKEETLQTLHNLNEDELDVFEQNWKANAQHLPDWSSGFNTLENADGQVNVWDQWPNWGRWALPSAGHWWPNLGGWALPSAENSGGTGGARPDIDGGNSSRARSKKVVRINVE